MGHIPPVSQSTGPTLALNRRDRKHGAAEEDGSGRSRQLTVLSSVGKQLPQLATTLEKQGSVSQAACVMLFGVWQTPLRGTASVSSTSSQRPPTAMVTPPKP